MTSHESIAEIQATYPSLRDRHPLLMAAAILPTAPVKEVARLVFDRAQRFRSSIAFWAHPLCGKSSCISALEKLAPTQYPGAAFVIYEPSSKDVAAEGALIEDMLSAIDFEPRALRSLAGKRDQLLRALYAMSVAGRHLFLVIDEAQNLHVKDLGWLKRMVNWLNTHEVKVTVVLFGQSQLCTMHQRFMAEMPDLTIRFMAELVEFRSLQDAADLHVVLKSCDDETEYPRGSGWSYTQYLWPNAHANGFRLARSATDLYDAFRSQSGGAVDQEGISMQWVAEALMLVGQDSEGSDAEGMNISREVWERAIVDSGYRSRTPAVLAATAIGRGRARRSP
ncbi:ATP-binding protein [Stenotrophomonas maltophilia]|uniref:ATP-binding protein n=1 Tax=Stenotrophomonas maltophilia TaxID=40324 RepID=UPI0013DD1484|nr:ATP-binding protein [Stenotrophomonas maltophilia]